MIDSLLRKLANIAEIEFARRHVDGTIYRWDNAKHDVWKNVKTFPHHFHENTDNNVIESPLPGDQTQAIKFILEFVRDVTYKK